MGCCVMRAMLAGEKFARATCSENDVSFLECLETVKSEETGGGKEIQFFKR